jgi:hypothetical protein
MSPTFTEELRALATQKLTHAKECETKAAEYDAAARRMRTAAAADRALAAEIGALRVEPRAVAKVQDPAPAPAAEATPPTAEVT